MGLWEISSRSPNCIDSLMNFTVSDFFKCSNCFSCSTWDSRKFDKAFWKTIIMFLKCCGRNSQSLNAIKRKSSRPEVFCKKGVVRNFAKFTGKPCARVSFLMKSQASDLQLYWKRDFGTGVFLWILWNL